jgi:hypothetical protein
MLQCLLKMIGDTRYLSKSSTHGISGAAVHAACLKTCSFDQEFQINQAVLSKHENMFRGPNVDFDDA